MRRTATLVRRLTGKRLAALCAQALVYEPWKGLVVWVGGGAVCAWIGREGYSGDNGAGLGSVMCFFAAYVWSQARRDP